MSPNYHPAIKIVLSGLTERSHGNGINKRSVRHAVLIEDYEIGRIKRKSGQLLCGNNRGSFDLSFCQHPNAEITCPQCSSIITKSKGGQS